MHIVLEEVLYFDVEGSNTLKTKAQIRNCTSLIQIESKIASFESNGSSISLDDAELPIHKMAATMKGLT